MNIFAIITLNSAAMFASYKLYHYSSNPLVLSAEYQYLPGADWLKPNGLWLSIGDEWLQWCQREDFFTFTPSDYYRAQLEVAEDAKICIVDCAAKLQHLMTFKTSSERCAHLYQNYDGVAFLNYAELRKTIPYTMELFWYRAIDVPSLCVWNTNVLKIADVIHVVE